MKTWIAFGDGFILGILATAALFAFSEFGVGSGRAWMYSGAAIVLFFDHHRRREKKDDK